MNLSAGYPTGFFVLCYFLFCQLLTFNKQIAPMRPTRFYSILFFLCIALFYSGVAQKLNPYYNFKHFNVENGLVENIVYHFLHDSKI